MEIVWIATADEIKHVIALFSIMLSSLDIVCVCFFFVSGYIKTILILGHSQNMSDCDLKMANFLYRMIVSICCLSKRFIVIFIGWNCYSFRSDRALAIVTACTVHVCHRIWIKEHFIYLDIILLCLELRLTREEKEEVHIKWS